jgi:hypothetical protein
MASNGPIVKRGTWLYDGHVPSEIRITRGGIMYGTGEPTDPPDIREDREVVSFNVWYESPPGSGEFPSGGGQYELLAEAMAAVERMLPGPVTWE